MKLNVTIGKYYPADSILHRLDPRVKLASTFAFIILLFVANDFWGYLLSGVSIFSVMLLSKIPLKFIFKGLRAVIFIILFTVVFNVFFVHGERVLFEFWIVRVTLEGVFTSIRLASRLVMLVLASSVLTLTTSPLQLTDGIEYGLKPLKKIGVPAHEIAMMMTIALRFIPTLMEEVDKISKAQMARGAEFDTGNIIDKAKAMVPLLVPLFISAFTRAEELAMAMEARCYRGDVGRTRMKVLKYTKSDYISSVLMVAFGSAIILIRVLL
ncbi:MAG: energy-coupling factor transporter transmembrane protein EcfT [Defluviitaleaceae bacterium]|nr:energy-coupling factor transporter transmembrane protein EcfT [Defluviitaleaceae bacterium]